MKIEVEVSEVNEATESPWWIIIDPKQNFNTNDDGIYAIASMITGPYFSREEAESFLKRTRYNFSKNAHVFCHSGYNATQYKNACRNPISKYGERITDATSGGKNDKQS